MVLFLPSINRKARTWRDAFFFFFFFKRKTIKRRILFSTLRENFLTLFSLE